MKYKCPVCGNSTLTEKPPGTYAICTVCGWEDDPVQYNEPDYQGGANKVSLNQAKVNYRLFGAVDKDALNSVRKPLDSERLSRN